MKISGSGPNTPIDKTEKLKKDLPAEKPQKSKAQDSSQLNLSRSLRAVEELSQLNPEALAQAQKSPSRESVDLLLNHLDSGKGHFSRVSSSPQKQEAALSFLEESAHGNPFSFAEAFSELDASRVAKLLED